MKAIVSVVVPRLNPGAREESGASRHAREAEMDDLDIVIAMVAFPVHN